MTPEQLQAIKDRWAGGAPHRCPECNSRPHRESDIADLLAEVERLNKMVDAACEKLTDIGCPDIGEECCDENCSTHKNGGDCWRKFFEQSVTP